MKPEHPAQLSRVVGALAEVTGLRGAALNELVHVGHRGLLGEVLRVTGDTATLQVFEETTGLQLEEPVTRDGLPLSIELGPGLLGSVIDGIGRPLARLAETSGDFIEPGATAPTLDRQRLWRFRPALSVGEHVNEGDVVGTVEERGGVVLQIMIPPGRAGTVTMIHSGEVTVDQPIVQLDTGAPLTLISRWPVRRPRPVARRLDASKPFLTGQRVFDFLFPIAEGGTVAVPGGFGTGKTVIEQSLAKYGDADVIVYIGCGERGNEMAEVLHEFSALIDPRTGRRVMDRTVLVVNTSNMPVAAREASVYVGLTIAEYFRDMGLRTAVMADSLSRWAEALREIGSRLQELPGEEGYPTSLASRAAKLHERAGRVTCLGKPEREGSVTLISAVSPPGGDFSEPVTQACLRVAGALWALDPALAHQRQFPAVDWETSYSLHAEAMNAYFDAHVNPRWSQTRARLLGLLQRDAELREVASVVGPEALDDKDRLLLATAALAREFVLGQSAFDERDAFSPPEKTFALADAVLRIFDESTAALQSGTPFTDLPNHSLSLRQRGEGWGEGPTKQPSRTQTKTPTAPTNPNPRPKTQNPTARTYRGAHAASGPLLTLPHAHRAALGEWATIQTTPTTPPLRGQIIDAGRALTVVQVLEDTLGLAPATATITLTGELATVPVGRDLLGRALSGLGEPRDGHPRPLGEARRPLWGAPLNPTRRKPPRDFIETGLSAIDGLNTLVRGQKLPVFSGPGLPALELAATIVENARAPRDEPFAVIFAAIGITERETRTFLERFQRSGALERSVLYLNQAQDPTIERLLTPRAALAQAEYLAFEHGLQVLVVMADITHYCEALREVAAAREEMPGRRGYPGSMYTDLASLFERAGVVEGRAGSVTQLPILTMPDDDITHPIPDLSGYITEGQVVLSRELHRRGVFPPIDVLPSLSRLMNAGIGGAHTVAEHRKWADQLYAIYARGREARMMVAIVGESGLSPADRRALAFTEAFERELVGQGNERRSLQQTIDTGWRLLDTLPREDLLKLSDELLAAHRRGKP